MKIAAVLTIMGVLLASAFLVSCSQKEPRPEPADNLSLVKDVSPDERDQLDIFSGGRAGLYLSQHLHTVTDFSPGVARREMLSLNNLKKQDEKLKAQMVSELLAAYARLEEEKYELRWLVIDLLAQLEINEAVDELSEISLVKIPPERMRANHHQSSIGEEIAIRLASVQGVVKLAANGNQLAQESLIQIARRSPVRVVKIHAVHAYLLSPLKSMKIKSLEDYKRSDIYQRQLETLRRQLPEETIKLVEIKAASLKNMPVPDDVLNSVKNADKKKTGFPLSPAPRVSETF